MIGVRGLFSLGSKLRLLAGYSDKSGRDRISLRCELHTGYCGIMRRCPGLGVCLNKRNPDGVPIPRHQLRQHLVVNPERVPCSGFIFMASANHPAQTCLASFAEFAIRLINAGRDQLRRSYLDLCQIHFLPRAALINHKTIKTTDEIDKSFLLDLLFWRSTGDRVAKSRVRGCHLGRAAITVAPHWRHPCAVFQDDAAAIC